MESLGAEPTGESASNLTKTHLIMKLNQHQLQDSLSDSASLCGTNRKHFRQFLRRISLPRLIHFLDLVLPQLMPVQAAWAGEEKTLWSCHHIRHLCDKQSANNTPRVQISYFFTSHDHVHHVRIQWNGHPLLLFSDPQMVEALPVEHFSKQASHVTHQQHLQMWGCAKVWPFSCTILWGIHNTKLS